MITHVQTSVLAALIAARLLLGVPAASPSDELWAAAQVGDLARITRALDAGADINARTDHGISALWFAADRGLLDAVRLLIDRGADLGVQDISWGYLPLDRALINEHLDVARYLLGRGSKGAASALVAGVRAKHVALVKTALSARDLDVRALVSALQMATRVGDAQITALVKAAVDAQPAEAIRLATVDAALLDTYAGTYRREAQDLTMTVTAGNGRLAAVSPGHPTLTLIPTGPATFSAAEVEGQTFAFTGQGGVIDHMTLKMGTASTTWERVVLADLKAAPAGTSASVSARAEAANALKARNWPSFRGPDASGIGDNQGAVVDWDVTTGKNIKWQTPIPGIATSSPIVWDDRIFVTTAISQDTTFRTAATRDLRPVDDLSENTWKIYALDKRTGRIVWEREVFKGPPAIKRHPKGSQANSTPVTDGRHVVAIFGTIGLVVCYDMTGKLLWKKNLGPFDSGWALDPIYQFGHASSPIIYKQTAIVQADVQKGSFLAAYDLATGKEVWRTERDEISTWGTPTIVKVEAQDEIVTNGPKIRGYNPETGTLLWTLGPNSEITVATPIAGPKFIYVTGGYPPVQPIYAIRPGARGDISLGTGDHVNRSVAWSNDREGVYIPTPIVYGAYLYTCSNNGILTAYDAETGDRIYRGRIGGGGGFSASPVAADGRLYVSSEDGDVFVIRAGPRYEEIARNSMHEVIMATPAVSDGLIIIRTLGHVYGIGQ